VATLTATLAATEAVTMFERFTDKARRVVVLAQEEARQLGHDHIGTEHILLGLLREADGVAARALDSLGIGLQSARDRLVSDPGSRVATRSGGHIPFTPEAKRTLELALREALLLGHDYIGTEHILLGLVRDADTRGPQVLTELGADPDTVRRSVIEIAPPRPVGKAQRLIARGGPRQRPGEPTLGYGALSTRLAALERWAGLLPDLADLDEQIAQVRRDKEAAIDAQEFRTAEALSDTEHELMAERDRRSRQRAAGPSLADQVAQLRAEVERLHQVLRRHGIDPGTAA
jgi:Clp amino terminal domain, pathogenicity island component